jgi:hypothetical protein
MDVRLELANNETNAVLVCDGQLGALARTKMWMSGIGSVTCVLCTPTHDEKRT